MFTYIRLVFQNAFKKSFWKQMLNLFISIITNPSAHFKTLDNDEKRKTTILFGVTCLLLMCAVSFLHVLWVDLLMPSLNYLFSLVGMGNFPDGYWHRMWMVIFLRMFFALFGMVWWFIQDFYIFPWFIHITLLGTADPKRIEKSRGLFFSLQPLGFICALLVFFPLGSLFCILTMIVFYVIGVVEVFNVPRSEAIFSLIKLLGIAVVLGVFFYYASASLGARVTDIEAIIERWAGINFSK